jgi:hypothetical protein
LSTCNITEDKFIEVINGLAKYEAVDVSMFEPITSLDQDILLTNIDSLGIMMMFIWLSAIFGIGDEEGKELLGQGDVLTGHVIVTFVKAYQTKSYTDEEVDFHVRSLL